MNKSLLFNNVCQKILLILLSEGFAKPGLLSWIKARGWTKRQFSKTFLLCLVS